jgi:hypothetical protein
VVTSDAEVGEPTQREACTQGDSFDLLAADLVSPDRCEEVDTLGGPSSADPKDQPDSKRRRPLSCLRWRSTPVSRQASALPQNGIFEDFAGLVLARSPSVIAPSKDMVTMAMFRAIQCTPMPDIRQLTVCSRKWAAERPRCLSFAVREADSLEAEATQRTAALFQAPLGILAVPLPFGPAASMQAKAAGSGPSAGTTASPHEGVEIEWISDRRLATMEWLPLPWSAEYDQAAPSLTVPCQSKGLRLGDTTQGLDPGCASAFATRGLPGRYDGVGEGGQSLQTRSIRWEKGRQPSRYAKSPITSIESREMKKEVTSSVRTCRHITVVCG